ncbi:MAG: hypothetical protein IPK82_15020 [Polyangiaceae bacterium]|nr:hypothetical protein [Polyangiaceae bacterium]
MAPAQLSIAVQFTSQGRLVGHVLVPAQGALPGHSNKHTPPVHLPPAEVQGPHSSDPVSHGPGAVVDVVEEVDTVEPPVPPVDDVDSPVEVEPAPPPPPPAAPVPDVAAPVPADVSDP